MYLFRGWAHLLLLLCTTGTWHLILDLSIRSHRGISTHTTTLIQYPALPWGSQSRNPRRRDALVGTATKHVCLIFEEFKL
jgi:hypothetical protein